MGCAIKFWGKGWGCAVLCAVLFLAGACEALSFVNPDDSKTEPDDANNTPVTPIKPDADANISIDYSEEPNEPFSSVSVRYVSGGGSLLNLKANAFTIPGEDREKTIFSLSFIPGGETVIMGRKAGDSIKLKFSKAKKLILRGVGEDGMPLAGGRIPIGSYSEFSKIRECLDKPELNTISVSFDQEGDIHLWGDERYKSAGLFRLWTPFGGKEGGEATPFNAVYDGNGKILWCMRIETDKARQGLFAAIGSEGIVKNVRLQDGYLEAGSESGLLCAVNEGRIENCAVNGTVKKALKKDPANGKKLGGLCGINEAGARITAGYYYGRVDAHDESGGICGENRGTLSACFHFGAIGDFNFTPAGVTANIHHLAGLNSGTLTGCYWFDPDNSAAMDSQCSPFSAGNWPALDTSNESAPWAKYDARLKTGRWKTEGSRSNTPSFAGLPKLWYE